MEIYLLAALIFIYIGTAVVAKADVVRKIWTFAFIGSGFLTALSLFAVRVKNQDVMLDAENFNWYYFLYIFGAVSFALGIINLWIYRRQLWNLLRSDTSKDPAKE